jgi:sec-independent protein translocase protein TatC
MSQNTTFWDHLEVIRWVLIRVVTIFIISTGTLFYFMPYLFDNVILAPCHDDFFLYELFKNISINSVLIPDFSNQNFNVNIININLATQFMIHITTSCYLAFIFLCPYFLFEIYHFIRPALYRSEKTNIFITFGLGSIMFLIGCAVSYCIIFPLTLRFLYQYEISSQITNQLSLNSYMSSFFSLILIIGLIFELPLLSWLLSKLGLLTRKFFKKYRRHAIVILLILAAIITPSGDPFTLMVVFLPIYGLYEISALFVRRN